MGVTTGRVGLLTLLRGGHELGWEIWEEKGDKMEERGNRESEERDKLVFKRIELAAKRWKGPPELWEWKS